MNNEDPCMWTLKSTPVETCTSTLYEESKLRVSRRSYKPSHEGLHWLCCAQTRRRGAVRDPHPRRRKGHPQNPSSCCESCCIPGSWDWINMKMDFMIFDVSRYHHPQYCTIRRIMEHHHYCPDVWWLGSGSPSHGICMCIYIIMKVLLL